MEDREKTIKEKIMSEEYEEMIQLIGAKQMAWNVLIKEKAFRPEDIEIEPQFCLLLSDCQTTVSMDFVINLLSSSFMIIRCTNSSLESWERYVIAFARVIKDYQIPYAVVTDGEQAKIIDVLKGYIIGESINELFNRQEALKIMEHFKKIPCPANRLEKEKRIVYAFEGIKCPIVKPEN